VKQRFETLVLVVSLALVGVLLGDCTLRLVEHFCKVNP
jgi:hypothetical protein